MLKLRILSIITTSANVFSSLFLYLDYGLTSQSSVYLLAITIFTVSQLVCECFTAQFIYRYQDIRKKSRIQSRLFYSNYILTGFLISFLITSLLLIMKKLIVSLLLGSLSKEEIDLCVKYVVILLPYLLFFLPSTLSQNYFIANNKLSLSYLFNLIPNLLLFFLFFSNHFFQFGLSELLKIYSISSSAALLILIIYSRPIIRLANYKTFIDIFLTIKKSVFLKMSHNIHNIGLAIAISNISASYNVEYRSLLLYAKKASDSIEHIAYAPVQKFFNNYIGSKRSIISFNNLKTKSQESIKSSAIFILLMTLGLYLLYKPIKLFLQLDDILAQYLFLVIGLFIIKVIPIIWEIPWTIYLCKINKFWVFYLANIFFLISIYSLERSFGWLKMLSFPVSTLISQVIVSLTIIYTSKKYLIKNSKKVI